MSTDNTIPLDPADDTNIQLHNYQDDIDADDTITDPIMDENTDDPTVILGVSPKEFKNELDNYDIDELGHGDDDRREQIEDLDEDEDMGRA